LIVFVGDKPSRLNKDPSVAFLGAACYPRLIEWATFLLGPGLENFRMINRVDPRFSEILTKNYTFIALGNAASKALGKTPHFKLPHPSGRNRQINDALFIKMKLSEAKDWLNSVRK
jgi:hypothetical protein